MASRAGWSAAEDHVIQSLVTKHGSRKWAVVAAELNAAGVGVSEPFGVV
jgi:hypothetical protein